MMHSQANITFTDLNPLFIFAVAVCRVTRFNSSLAGFVIKIFLHASAGDPDASRLNVIKKFASVS